MGRHLKKGLDYFNIDCVQEDSLNYLEAKHGISGYGVLVKLWRKIYMIEGYYCDWSEKNIYLFSKEVGVPIDELNKIVDTCLSEGIFHREIHKDYGVLTSHGVQKRWLRIVFDAKRKDIKMRPNLIIIEKTTDETAFTPEETIKTPEESTQMKVNDIKVEEIKESEGGHGKPAPARKVFIPPTVEEARNYFLSTVGNTKRQGCWPADRCKMEADLFFNNYQGVGWKTNKGAKLVDWKATARKWIGNENKWAGSGTISPKKETIIPKNGTPIQKSDTISHNIDKVASEINFLYSRFCEDPNLQTIATVETIHYDYLKRGGKISFTEDKAALISQMAMETLQEKELEDNQMNMKMYMKKIGVIEFFKQLKETGAEAVFHAEN